MPHPGQVVTNRVLGTEAVYRVVEVNGDLVELEVASAPGLSAGDRVGFTLQAVQAMS
jgi:hypothetical protein